MKKLLGISALALLLAACSTESQPPRGPAPHNNEAMEAAMQSCHSSSAKDQSAFETCMKSKGFEKPADHPNKDGKNHPAGAPKQGNNQALEKAMKECHSSTTSKSATNFDSCMKAKGFEKPADKK